MTMRASTTSSLCAAAGGAVSMATRNLGVRRRLYRQCLRAEYGSRYSLFPTSPQAKLPYVCILPLFVRRSATDDEATPASAEGWGCYDARGQTRLMRRTWRIWCGGPRPRTRLVAGDHAVLGACACGHVRARPRGQQLDPAVLSLLSAAAPPLYPLCLPSSVFLVDETRET